MFKIYSTNGHPRFEDDFPHRCPLLSLIVQTPIQRGWDEIANTLWSLLLSVSVQNIIKTIKSLTCDYASPLLPGYMYNGNIRTISHVSGLYLGKPFWMYPSFCSSAQCLHFKLDTETIWTEVGYLLLYTQCCTLVVSKPFLESQIYILLFIQNVERLGLLANLASLTDLFTRNLTINWEFSGTFHFLL